MKVATYLTHSPTDLHTTTASVRFDSSRPKINLLQPLAIFRKQILSVCTLLGVLCGQSAAAQTANPNIVILLADDMGYGDPGCYNPQSKIATPNMDRLAHEGMRFTDAHAPGPLCHPSRYGLITGRYPFRTDISRWPQQPLIEKGQVTIASLLRDQGYQTAMVGKWHLGFRESRYDQPLPGGPVDCGFDSFFGLRASTDIPPYFYIRGDRAVTPPTDHISGNLSENWSPIQGAFWREGGIAPSLELKDVLPRLTDEACAVISGHIGVKASARQPLLLYLAYTAPHTPWLPSAEFAGKSRAGMYGDFVMMVDAQIGRVLAALERADMMQNTLLIFTSDNGPVWYPQDVARLGHDAVGGLRGMKADAWEGGHRMPFIVRWPGRVKAGTVSDQRICFTDLLATFADVCGAKLPAGAGSDSFSILPVLEGRQPEGKPVRGPIVMQAGSSSTMMIRSGDWKLIDHLGSGGFSKPAIIKSRPGEPDGQLYNLLDDPAETNNLYLKHPEIVARLKAEMQRIVNAEHGR
jgi:arylsulfatase A